MVLPVINSGSGGKLVTTLVGICI